MTNNNSLKDNVEATNEEGRSPTEFSEPPCSPLLSAHETSKDVMCFLKRGEMFFLSKGDIKSILPMLNLWVQNCPWSEILGIVGKLPTEQEQEIYNDDVS